MPLETHDTLGWFISPIDRILFGRHTKQIDVYIPCSLPETSVQELSFVELGQVCVQNTTPIPANDFSSCVGGSYRNKKHR